MRPDWGHDCQARNLTQQYRIPEASGKEGTAEGKQLGSESTPSLHVCPFPWCLCAVKKVPDPKDVAVLLSIAAVFDLPPKYSPRSREGGLETEAMKRNLEQLFIVCAVQRYFFF